MLQLGFFRKNAQEINTPKRTDIKTVYRALAARAGNDERLAFSKRRFTAWIMADGIAVSRPTITSLWYQVIAAPFAIAYNEERDVVTLDAGRLAAAAGVAYAHTHIHTDGEYIIREEVE